MWFSPWILAVVSVGLIAWSRLQTNFQLLSKLERILAAGTWIGFVPRSVSLVNIAGWSGLWVSLFWSFLFIGWWGAIPVVLLYFVSCLVPDDMPHVAGLLESGKRAAQTLEKMQIEKPTRELLENEERGDL